MLKKVKRYINMIQDADEPFEQFYIKYMTKVQDQNIDMEVRNQLRFGLLQLSQFDAQIETDYRKLVNDNNAKFS